MNKSTLPAVASLVVAMTFGVSSAHAQPVAARGLQPAHAQFTADPVKLMEDVAQLRQQLAQLQQQVVALQQKNAGLQTEADQATGGMKFTASLVAAANKRIDGVAAQYDGLNQRLTHHFHIYNGLPTGETQVGSPAGWKAGPH